MGSFVPRIGAAECPNPVQLGEPTRGSCRGGGKVPVRDVRKPAWLAVRQDTFERIGRSRPDGERHGRQCQALRILGTRSSSVRQETIASVVLSEGRGQVEAKRWDADDVLSRDVLQVRPQRCAEAVRVNDFESVP
jgi:hypothetical protein